MGESSSTKSGTSTNVELANGVAIPSPVPLFDSLKTSMKETYFHDDPLRQFKNESRPSWTRKLVMGLQYLLPILEWGPRYSLELLKHDFVAGIAVTSIAIPQGIGNAHLAITCRRLLAYLGLSLLRLLFLVSRPRIAVLGNIPDSVIYRSSDQYPNAINVPRILILEISSPIFFANSCYLREIKLFLANPRGEVIEKLNKSKLIEAIGQKRIYLTVGDAVEGCNSMLYASKPKQLAIESDYSLIISEMFELPIELEEGECTSVERYYE